MRMSTLLALGAMLTFAACTAAAPPASPTDASPAPFATDRPSPSSSVTVPVQPPPTPVESWIPSDASQGEIQLLGGARLDLQRACAPLRTGLPDGAVAAIECRPASDDVERAVIFLFDTRDDLMAAYSAFVEANEIELYTNGGRCEPGRPSEGGYVPGDGHGIVVDERGACWLDASGDAHYVVTLPPFVLGKVDGKIADMTLVERYAWLGNQDQPGGPTLWSENGPMSPEK